MGNPAEETCCYPNTLKLRHTRRICQLRNLRKFCSSGPPPTAAILAARGRKTGSVLALQSRAPVPKIGCPGARRDYTHDG